MKKGSLVRWQWREARGESAGHRGSRGFRSGSGSRGGPRHRRGGDERGRGRQRRRREIYGRRFLLLRRVGGREFCGGKVWAGKKVRKRSRRRGRRERWIRRYLHRRRRWRKRRRIERDVFFFSFLFLRFGVRWSGVSPGKNRGIDFCGAGPRRWGGRLQRGGGVRRLLEGLGIQRRWRRRQGFVECVLLEGGEWGMQALWARVASRMAKVRQGPHALGFAFRC